uniref:Capsid protein n=1 Tax=Anelloviridae sp. ctTSS12 TaxID=2828019 RepID=A0A8S5RY13_9VIRU|nr:MAG TPA: TT viral orf 1 [Anelloviridae sp. ctTSS12]
MYEKSFVPEKHPGGGGFAVMQFTLANLYSMHQSCSNWWTQTNQDLPLCKYKYCKLKCYQSQNVDYVLKYTNYLPANSNKLTYPACQPSMLMMASNKIVVPSRKTQKNRKPYKKLKIYPPQQLQTKWYFQKDLQTLPLLVLHTAPTTLENYYLGSNWDSNNITIQHLNTVLIQNRTFSKPEWAFKTIGTQGQYFYYYSGQEHSNHSDQFLVKDLTPLTNTLDWTHGCDYETYNRIYTPSTLSSYTNNWEKYAGNPFIKEYLENLDAWYYSTTPPNILMSRFTQQNMKVADIKIQESPTQISMTLTKLQEQIILQSRYNPFKDTGDSTNMFLLETNKGHGWDPPPQPEYRLEGFPLWLNIFGFCDFQKRLRNLISPQTNYILCFTNTTTDPKRNFTIVPIDTNFTTDKSPYVDFVQEPDKKIWHPQLQFQSENINNIAKCGPGAVKLNDLADEIKIEYSFKFLWGGAPAKMVTVDNPDKQAQYPIPRFEHETPSLQSPAQAFETVMYSFDQRDHQLTKAALERITKDWGPENSLSSITETTRQEPIQQTLQTLLDQTPETEESEEEILQQLQLHKQQQQQLRLRILKLMSNL